MKNDQKEENFITTISCHRKPTLLGAFGGVSLVLEPVLCRPIVVGFREKIFGGIFDDGFVEFDGVLPTPKGPQPAVVAGGCLGEIWSEDVQCTLVGKGG